MKVTRIHVATVGLRLRSRFRHATYDRETTRNLLVKVHLSDGTVGYGEGVPREYVTGETADGAYEIARTDLAHAVIGRRWTSYDRLRTYLMGDELGNCAGTNATAQCAIEIALLDAGGKHFGRSVSELLGPRRARWVRYGVAISADSLDDLRRKMRRYRLFGIHSVKVKVGADDSDVARVALARAIMGPRAIIGLDVNGAWSVDQAIKRLGQLAVYGVRFVEEPTTPGDIDALAAVTARSPIPVGVDESLCTEDDARRLIHRRACNFFNLRISKCGGIMACVKLAQLASEHGLQYAVGCHVGESSILSAAGRHLILGLGNVSYAEGSYGKFLLTDDLTQPSVRFGWGGVGLPIRGPGLGVQVRAPQVNRHLEREERVE